MSESKLKLSEEQRALNRERWNKMKTQPGEKKMLKYQGAYIKQLGRKIKLKEVG